MNRMKRFMASASDQTAEKPLEVELVRAADTGKKNMEPRGADKLSDPQNRHKETVLFFFLGVKQRKKPVQSQVRCTPAAIGLKDVISPLW